MQGLKGPDEINGPYGNLHVWHLVATDYVRKVQEEEVTNEIHALLASERDSKSKVSRVGSIMKHPRIDSKQMIMSLVESSVMPTLYLLGRRQEHYVDIT